MEPKEKAKELYNKYRNVETNYSLDGGYNFVNTHYTDAINYALIAVNEIINILENKLDYKMIKSVEYWTEVRNELLKL